MSEHKGSGESRGDPSQWFANPHSLRSVLDAAPTLVAVAGLDGYYKYVNQAFERILGFTREESLSRPFLDFIHPEDRDSASAIFAKLASGETVVNFEDRNVCKDGSSRWINWTVVPQMNEGLVYGIGHDVTQRHHVEQQLREAHEKLERRVEERTAELREALLSQERDRRLIASEIHDGLAQQLVGAKMHLEAYRIQRERRPEQAEQNLQECLDLLVRGVQESRNLIQGLRPPDLDGLGLVPAIRHIADDAGKAGLPVEVDSDLGDDRLPGRIEDTVYRIVQEGLTNARVHSGSDRAWVRLRRTEDWLRIEIRDRGCGFDPEAVRKGCHGLRGARQRVRVYGGSFTIESRVGEGTRLVVVLPLEQSEQEDSLG